MFTSISRRSRAVVSAAAILTIAFGTAPVTAHADPRIGQTQPERAIDAGLLDQCPINGPATFEDSWGWARSGGRTHEGVDMIADRGTPVIAVRDGDAQFKTSNLGGRAIWLTTHDGDRFYYAHLDRWEGDSRSVKAGDLIGYVGSTGNARGPHLHFETQPNGNVENPYPHTLTACVPAALAATEQPRHEPTTRSRSLPLR